MGNSSRIGEHLRVHRLDSRFLPGVRLFMPYARSVANATTDCSRYNPRTMGHDVTVTRLIAVHREIASLNRAGDESDWDWHKHGFWGHFFKVLFNRRAFRKAQAFAASVD